MSNNKMLYYSCFELKGNNSRVVDCNVTCQTLEDADKHLEIMFGTPSQRITNRVRTTLIPCGYLPEFIGVVFAKSNAKKAFDVNKN